MDACRYGTCISRTQALAPGTPTNQPEVAAPPPVAAITTFGASGRAYSFDTADTTSSGRFIAGGVDEK
jgi:hypothetical protein